VVCDEHGIGGSGEYCGDIDAYLGRIGVFYLEARRRVPTAIDLCGDNDAYLGRMNVFHLKVRRRVLTAIDLNSPKVHRRED
jgi:hypothetical protein